MIFRYFGILLFGYIGILIALFIPMLYPRIGWGATSIVMSVIAIATMLPISYLGKERYVSSPEKEPSLKQMLQYVAKNKPLLIFNLATIVACITATGSTAGNYVAIYLLGSEDYITYIALLTVIPTFLAVLLTKILLKKIDKFYIYIGSVASNVLFSVILFFVSRKYLISDDVPQEEELTAEETSGKKMNPIRFVFNPRVICFFLFMLIPLLIGGYFLYYMFPIIGSEWGLSETYIGYAYVLNGFFAVALGKTATQFFSQGKRKPLGLFTAVVFYGAAFFLVSYFQNVESLLVALIILGIADSFGIPLLTNYYTDIKAVEHYGYDRALSVYSLFENGAQSLGSFVFGIVLTVGVAKGLRTMIMVMGVLAVCFLVSVLFCMRKEKKTGGA